MSTSALVEISTLAAAVSLSFGVTAQSTTRRLPPFEPQAVRMARATTMEAVRMLNSKNRCGSRREHADTPDAGGRAPRPSHTSMARAPRQR